MFKKISYVILIVIALPVFAYLVAVYLNNREVAYPTKDQMQQQLERSVQWLVDNENVILQQGNPMLWWMLYEAEKRSGDARLAELLNKYFLKYSRIKDSGWGPLFGAAPHNYLPAYSVDGLPYYNKHFIYSLNCAKSIADDLLIVEQQNQPGFCHQLNYIYRPACATHQLMGINFLSVQNCGLLPDIKQVTESLQGDIRLQLMLDVRLVDVYLQRVLMLLITGAVDEVKPVWLQQVLDHQLEDGGWGDFVSLIDLSPDRSVGFSSRILSLGKEKSSYHATPQGVLILTYLLYLETKS